MEEWRVTLDLEPAEVGALQPILPTIIPAERHALITGGCESGPEEAYLTVDVVAATVGDALKEATRLYRRARCASRALRRFGTLDWPPWRKIAGSTA